MPSPIGHALGGVAAGWAVAGAPSAFPATRAAWWREVFGYAVLGMLPDADLLVGAHSGPTHGVGFALLVAVIVWLASHRRPRPAGSLRLAVACGVAYASHILLDWLGTDTSAPIGIMALWPFSREYYQSGLQLFMAVSRRYWRPELFWWPNFLALIRELLILVPVLVIVQRVRRRE